MTTHLPAIHDIFDLRYQDLAVDDHICDLDASDLRYPRLLQVINGSSYAMILNHNHHFKVVLDSHKQIYSVFIDGQVLVDSINFDDDQADDFYTLRIGTFEASTAVIGIQRQISLSPESQSPLDKGKPVKIMAIWTHSEQ